MITKPFHPMWVGGAAPSKGLSAPPVMFCFLSWVEEQGCDFLPHSVYLKWLIINANTFARWLAEKPPTS